jgi:hypothetical protein
MGMEGAKGRGNRRGGRRVQLRGSDVVCCVVGGQLGRVTSHVQQLLGDKEALEGRCRALEEGLRKATADMMQALRYTHTERWMAGRCPTIHHEWVVRFLILDGLLWFVPP